MPCTPLTGEQSILSLHSTCGQSMNTTKVIHDLRPENITKVMFLFFTEYHLGGMKKAENQIGSLLLLFRHRSFLGKWTWQNNILLLYQHDNNQKC